ncbi:MAG: peptidase dimerization domain-containing protein, partial [Gammaproteobacteria bacterium]|nr:peptidase dimerization domain-containing protein [Gammaproteobacteria bacterium]
PVKSEIRQLLLDNTWGPTLCVTGASGIPVMGNAGNVLRPNTTLKLSFRLPPTTDAEAAGKKVKEILERDPPHGARVRFSVESAMGGWNAPAVSDWLHAAMMSGSRAYFGADSMYMGTGGSIPFMGMLGEKFPGVQFLVTGLLGPHSNAHGPNEFLHIDTGKKVTACVAQVLAAHYAKGSVRKAA